jgi:hypothetical protein
MKIEIPVFKIRASAASKIMANGKGSGGLTDRQKEELADLQAKGSKSKKVQELIDKRDKPPELSAGAKTYCKAWLKEQKGFYGRRKEIKSKYLDKGNECEDEAIGLLNKIHLEDYIKNEEFFEDDDLQGTPDIIANLTRDTKCSYDETTFPLFEDFCDDDYYWQGQVYMELTDRPAHSVDYCLIDTPDHLIEREIEFAAYTSPKPDEELREYYYNKMRFTDITSLKLRVKSFCFNRDKEKIQQLRQRVKMCREYIKTLVEKVAL